MRSLIKYDRRAGSYIDLYSKTMKTSPDVVAYYDGEIREMKYKKAIDAHLDWLAGKIIGLDVNSLIEVGAGELTTIAPLKSRFKKRDIDVHASELTWSRIHAGRDYFKGRGIKFHTLSNASVLELPYKDNSFDCVLAHYFLEELSGHQEEAIRELVRISNKYVILVEASYELGNKYQRRKLLNRKWNMEIIPAIKRNGWSTEAHELVPYCDDAYHHGAMHLIKVPGGAETGEVKVCCSICKGDLVQKDSFLKCDSCSVVFPVLDGIPVMLTSNAIVASLF